MIEKNFSERSPRPSRLGAASGARWGASWGALGRPLAPQVALWGVYFFFWYRLGHPKGRPGAVLETLGGPLQPSGDPLGVPDHAKTASEVQWTLEEAFSDLSTNLKIIGFTIVKRTFVICRPDLLSTSPGCPKTAQEPLATAGRNTQEV